MCAGLNSQLVTSNHPASIPPHRSTPAIARTSAILTACACLTIAVAAHAACNLIPQTVKVFDGTLGSLNRPFAAPGEPVEVRVRPCDGGSAGLSSTLTDQNVTVVFTPAGGTPNAVVLTAAADCSGLTSQLAACQAQLAGGQVICGAGAAAGLQLLKREDGPHLQFLFPDTTALLNSSAGRTLSGPASIAVSPAATPLPCGLATASCAAQSGLIACVDDFFSNDGTCSLAAPQGVFNHFTALPVPNDFGADCVAEAPPCTTTGSEFRLTRDKDGNILLPMNWQKILVRQNGTPFPRLLRALLSAPAAVNVGPSFAASFTPEGGPLAPIFVPQVDPTTPRTVLNLFGSADAPYTILRVARRSASFQQCVGGAYTSLGAVPCNSSDECPAVCDGGTNPGQYCTGNSDCTGGGCGAAGTCGPTVCFGGRQNGSACTSDANCPGGECGPSAFNAGLLGLLAFHGVGPVIIPQAVNTCAAGTNATQACTSNSDCPFGICIQNGICQQSGASCGAASACSTGTGPCVQYALTADNPIPLQSLAAQTDQVFGFTAQEQVDNVDRNGDGDMLDYVVTLRDRTTGAEQFLGAPAGCGISGTPEGRAVVALHQPPFVFPSVATQGSTLAFLESEPQEGYCDENGDADHFDSILRVFKLGPTEVTAGLSPVRVVDAAPVFNGQSVHTPNGLVTTGQALAVSNGVVYYRRSEAEQARSLTEPTSSSYDIDIGTPSLSADGRFMAFTSRFTTLDPNCTHNGEGNVYVRDRATGTTECESLATDGTEPNAMAFSPALSADGRFVVFESSATTLVPNDNNHSNDTFVRDRCVSNGVPVVPPCTPSTERISVSSTGAEANTGSLPMGNGGTRISDDGRFVVFDSDASNLTTSDTPQVFVRDRQTGKTVTASVSSSGTPQNHRSDAGYASNASISGDGRFVAFDSEATNLVPIDGSYSALNVFVHDLQTGETEFVSIGVNGAPGNSLSFFPTVSSDGRSVAFESFALNLDPSCPTNSSGNVYVRDRTTGTTECESRASDGTVANNAAYSPVISADGRSVIFVSDATNLVPNDTNFQADVFVHDRITGMTGRVSVDGSGNQGNTASGGFGTFPAISADGHVAAFASLANNLGPMAAPTPQIYARGPDPSDTTSDITGDGDRDDTVLEQLDTSSSTATTLCPADQVAVAGGVAAFLRPEAAGTTPKLPGCPTSVGPLVNGNPDLNNDGDATDDVVHVARGGTVQNLQLAASAVSISAQCSAGSNSGEICDADADCPGASCAASWIAALATEAVPSRTELEIHPATRGSWTDVGQAADSAQVSGSLVAFITPEAMQGVDLNGDHDKTDRVIQVYDAATLHLTNLGQAAEEFVMGSTTPHCAQSPVLAFRTSEAAQRADLNGDGDRTDFVLQFWAKGLNSDMVINTGQAVTPCGLHACDPRQPYQVNSSQIKFLTRGTDQRQDLSGNGNLNDLVLQIFDVCTGERTVVGAVDPTVDTANPLAAAGTTNPITPAGVVVTGGNRCFTTGAACFRDGDCTAPAACVAGGICGTPAAVPASCATSADCPTATSCLPDRVVAAPAAVPAQHDSVLLPPVPLTITIPKCKAPATTCSATKLLNVGLRNADIGPPVEKPGHIIQVSASDGTCPSGTVTGCANVNKTGSDSVLLAGGKTAKATIPISVSSAAFTTFNGFAPTRCRLQVAAATVLTTGQDNRDPSPSDNTVEVELNVIDRNDPAQSAPPRHESTIASARPVTVTIPRDKTGHDANAAVRTVTLIVGNADRGDTDSITVTATDGTCPVGTAAGVNLAGRNAPPTNSANVTGGKRASGKLTLNLSAAGFATHNSKAPSRCAVQVTATGPSNPDPSPSNNVTNLTIDVIDRNDF